MCRGHFSTVLTPTPAPQLSKSTTQQAAHLHLILCIESEVADNPMSEQTRLLPLAPTLLNIQTTPRWLKNPHFEVLLLSL